MLFVWNETFPKHFVHADRFKRDIGIQKIQNQFNEK